MTSHPRPSSSTGMPRTPAGDRSRPARPQSARTHPVLAGARPRLLAGRAMWGFPVNRVDPSSLNPPRDPANHPREPPAEAAPEPDDADDPLPAWAAAWWLPKVSLSRYLRSLTFGITFVQICLFIATTALSKGFTPAVQNWAFGPTQCALIAMGGNYVPFAVVLHEYWRFLVSPFLHTGLITLFLGVFTQYVLLLPMEHAYGAPVVLVVYVLAATASSVFACAADPTGMDVGSGSGIVGCAGFNLAHTIVAWPERLNRERAGVVEAVVTLVHLCAAFLLPFVEASAVFSGALVGALMGGIYFAHELDASLQLQSMTRILCGCVLTFVLAVWTALLVEIHYYDALRAIVLSGFCRENPPPLLPTL